MFDAALSGLAHWSGGQQSLPVTLRLSYLAGGAAAGERLTLQGAYQAGAEAPVAGLRSTTQPCPTGQRPPLLRRRRNSMHRANAVLT